jgi:hypothetical protein
MSTMSDLDVQAQERAERHGFRPQCNERGTFAGPLYDTTTRCQRPAGHAGHHESPGRIPESPYRWLTDQPVERLLWGRWSAV